MNDLEQDWPDPNQRDAGLLRLVARVFYNKRRSNGRGGKNIKFLRDREDKITDEDIEQLLSEHHVTRSLPTNELDQLDIRILACYANGLQSGEAAEILGVGYELVRWRVKRINRILATKTRCHAVAEAIRQGLID